MFWSHSQMIYIGFKCLVMLHMSIYVKTGDILAQNRVLLQLDRSGPFADRSDPYRGVYCLKFWKPDQSEFLRIDLLSKICRSQFTKTAITSSRKFKIAHRLLHWNLDSKGYILIYNLIIFLKWPFYPWLYLHALKFWKCILN